MKREANWVNAWNEDEKDGCRVILAGTIEGMVGPYLCVIPPDEDRYVSGEEFGVVGWMHAEGIKEPKYRPYKLCKEEAKLFMNTALAYRDHPKSFETVTDINTQDELDEYFHDCETLEGEPFGVLIG